MPNNAHPHGPPFGLVQVLGDDWGGDDGEILEMAVGAGPAVVAGGGNNAQAQNNQRYRLDFKKLIQEWMHDDGSIHYLYKFRNIRFYLDRPASNVAALEEAFKTGKNADVVLVVDGKEIKAIKALLTIHSSVFDEAFKFAGDDDDNRLEIRGVDYDIMKEVVRGVYVGAVTISGMNDAFNIFMAADKYAIEFIKNQAEEYIVNNINKDNVVSILNFGRERDVPTIVERATKFITPSNCKLTSLPNYHQLDAEMKERILESLFE